MRKFVLAVALFTSAMPAAAATIVDTGVKSSFPFKVRAVSAFSSVFGKFNVGTDTRIESVETFGSVVIGGDAWFRLYANDAGGNLPGTLLYSATADFDSSGPNWRGVSGLVWNVLSGDYWVGYGAAPSSRFYASTVRGSAPNPLGDEAYYTKFTGLKGDDSANLSWRINGSEIVSAVPEPETWAMLVGGFTLIGGALRRRRGQGAAVVAA